MRREKLDARFRRASKATRWLYKHHLITEVIKVAIQDFIDDRWMKVTDSTSEAI